MLPAPAPWHEGERAVQRRVGELASADAVGAGIRDRVPDVAAEFLATQRLAVVAAVDHRGMVWASLLTGPPGFVDVPDPHQLAIAATVAGDDPLAETLADPALVGLLMIEPGTRRRSRINGVARPDGRGGLTVEVHQAFANCPKYIQRRALDPDDAPAASSRQTRAGGTLTPAQQRWAGTADTFFIATADASGNADASHRGGDPGFVGVDGNHLRFADHPGNSMYMTLGNLEQRPAAGLLLLDWDDGATLQVSGTARVDYDVDLQRSLTGRALDIEVHAVVEATAASPLRWGEPTPSRFNPPVIS